MEDTPFDCGGEHIGGDASEYGQMWGRVGTGCSSEDDIAIEGGMNRANRAGEAILGHFGQFMAAGFIELSICGDDCEGGVATTEDQVCIGVIEQPHAIGKATIGEPCPSEDLVVAGAAHIAKGIGRHECCKNGAIGEGDCGTADAAFGRLLDAEQLTNCCSGTSADTPLLHGGATGMLACRIAHCWVGPMIRASKGEIEEHRSWDDRHPCDAHIKPAALFAQPFHHATGSSKAVSTTTGQADRIDMLHHGMRC